MKEIIVSKFVLLCLLLMLVSLGMVERCYSEIFDNNGKGNTLHSEDRNISVSAGGTKSFTASIILKNHCVKGRFLKISCDGSNCSNKTPKDISECNSKNLCGISEPLDENKSYKFEITDNSGSSVCNHTETVNPDKSIVIDR
ncbi:MAG: hypothetical protein HQK88_06165 [Nitrospirae bacterium]|nr:hypothetical protein [Nitrospirota bacterium]MBF0534710.1 hypothetical protein [Nitrospirota bacterium]MBF0616384.1 hypothetical protein [Nitrospirota bacterium]